MMRYGPRILLFSPAMLYCNIFRYICAAHRLIPRINLAIGATRSIRERGRARVSMSRLNDRYRVITCPRFAIGEFSG